MASHRFCDGMKRRDFVKVGALGGSLSLVDYLRLAKAGDVAPINVSLLSNYANVFAGLKNKAHNSLDGVPYGVPHGRGANVLMWNTKAVTTAPTSWDPVWEGGAAYKGKISVYDSSIYIADAAIHLMKTKPELGIKNPYQLNETQFAAAIKLLEAQRDKPTRLPIPEWDAVARNLPEDLGQKPSDIVWYRIAFGYAPELAVPFERYMRTAGAEVVERAMP